jgi:hypothetical protein
MSHSRVVCSNSGNIGCIPNINAGGERAAKTAQCTYSSCHDTIGLEILNWSQSRKIEMSGFGGTPSSVEMVWVLVWENALQLFSSGSNHNPESFRRVGTVANTTPNPCGIPN